MLLKTNDILEVCQLLAEHENLQATVKEVGKSAIVVGAGAALGGLLGGPRGLALGGAITSVIMGIYDIGRYRSVVDILKNDLTPDQRRKLANAVRRTLDNIQAADVISLLGVILSSKSLKEVVIKEIGAFFLQELSMKIC